jgi:hypothetical protein
VQWPSQRRLDAVCDAETLRLFIREGRFSCGQGPPPGWEIAYVDLERVILEADPWWEPPELVTWATWAARWARRACPALGDE